MNVSFGSEHELHHQAFVRVKTIITYETSRGGAANFGFISITYHQYIFGLYKYILRLEISIFDRENNKNRQELRIIICFRDIQSGRGTTINVGY